MTDPTTTHERGTSGESSAALHLKIRGYRILERNFRVPSGEIDLIVRKGGVLAFVEVKLRRTRRRGRPLEAVNERKVRRISAAAAAYLQSRAPRGVKTYRFDVIGVGPERNLLGLMRVEHVENAFEAPPFFTV